MEFRNRLVENYGELFGSTSDGQLDAGTNFSRKYGWFQSIFSALAQNDIRRLEDITKLNFHLCFTFLSFTKEKAEIEAQQIKSKF